MIAAVGPLDLATDVRDPALPAGRIQALRSMAMGPALLAYNLVLFVLVGRRPSFPDVHEFPMVEEFEDAWPKVRAEVDRLLEDVDIPPYVDVEPDQRNFWKLFGRVLGKVAPETNLDDRSILRWRTFVLRTYGRDVEANRERCPETAALLDRVPGLTGAMFSVLDPDVKLPLHFGLFLGALRLHLGVKIPEPGATAIRVGGVERAWVEGEAFVFEHSRWHTAWNRGTQQRVILILDFERPMRWPWLGRLNHRVISALGEAQRTRSLVAHIEELTMAPVPASSASSADSATA